MPQLRFHINFESDPDHLMDPQNIRDLNFLIYLILGIFLHTHLVVIFALRELLFVYLLLFILMVFPKWRISHLLLYAKIMLLYFSQKALSICFEREIAIFNQPECYFQSLAMELLPKRDYIADVLRTAGLEPIIPQGGYFIMADFTKLGMLLDKHLQLSKFWSSW